MVDVPLIFVVQAILGTTPFHTVHHAGNFCILVQGNVN
jgi:hypothetical protein